MKVKVTGELKLGTPWKIPGAADKCEARQQYRIYDKAGLCPCLPSTASVRPKIIDDR